MKPLVFFILTILFISCASQNRQIASEEEESLYRTERTGDFGAGYRH